MLGQELPATPVVQDDDLGALAASFNRMQTGLAERQRLQAAFGTYVDPDLAARLLEQGDDIFTGERREVTMMFVDIRDFSPSAEASTAGRPSPASTTSSKSSSVPSWSWWPRQQVSRRRRAGRVRRT